MREQGMFSNRYLLKKGKQNISHNNNTIGHNNNAHADQTDFPLAYTSTKYTSREKSPITGFKKRQEKKAQIVEHQHQKNQHHKEELVAKLQKQLKDTKDQLKRLNKEMLYKGTKNQNALNQLKSQLQFKDGKITSLGADLKRDAKKFKDQDAQISRYRETIKQQIYWLLKFFVNLQSKKLDIEDIKTEIGSNYQGFLPYIQEFNIQKQLQELASTSSIKDGYPSRNYAQSQFHQNNSKINMDSMFTQEFEDNHLVKIMELQPLIQTFNNNQNCLEQPHEKDKIAKRLFEDSPLFKEQKLQVVSKISLASHDNSIDQSRNEQNQFLKDEKRDLELPMEVLIVKNFQPQGNDENYIALKKGQTLKLLRKIRKNLWIGQYGEKIGLVQQAYFKMH